jgi:hypothetical protein
MIDIIWTPESRHEVAGMNFDAGYAEKDGVL